MERGPMALFGAIVAVGLGPALWLGAQFGDGAGSAKPPAITREVKAEQDQGGVAGATREDPPVVVDIKPRGRSVPLPRTSGTATATPSARPTATKPPVRVDRTVEPTGPAADPTPGDGPSATPTTEPPNGPTTPPAADNSAQPPIPPAGGDQDPTGGQGAGDTGTPQGN